jgi:hypothetical protein
MCGSCLQSCVARLWDFIYSNVIQLCLSLSLIRRLSAILKIQKKKGSHTMDVPRGFARKSKNQKRGKRKKERKRERERREKERGERRQVKVNLEKK